jgi:TetR/AcrR family transcriptional regulator, lmrAB and yxaGH operons repressor
MMHTEVKAPRENRTKQMMIRAAADLMQRRGYVGTGVAEILSQAGAPRGSLYYHFPGGKREIALEAIAYARRVFARDLDRIAAESHSLDVYLAALGALSKRDLISSNFDASCPIAAAALDVPNEETEILAACAETFNFWSHSIAEGLARHIVGEAQTASLGALFLRALFGAAMAARAARDAQIIDDTIAQLRLLIVQPSKKLRSDPARRDH